MDLALPALSTALALPALPVPVNVRAPTFSGPDHERWQNESKELTNMLSSNVPVTQQIGEGQKATIFTINENEQYVFKVFKDPDAAANMAHEVRSSNVASLVHKSNKAFTRPITVEEVSRDSSDYKHFAPGSFVLRIERFPNDARKYTTQDPNIKEPVKTAQLRFDVPGVRTASEQLVRDVEALHAAGVAHGDIHSGNIAERKIASGGFQFVLFDYGSAVVSPFSEHYTAFKAYTKNDVRRPHLEKALETLRNLKKERGSAFATSETFQNFIISRDYGRSAKKVDAKEKHLFVEAVEDYLKFLKEREYDLRQLGTLRGIRRISTFGTRSLRWPSYAYRIPPRNTLMYI